MEKMSNEELRNLYRLSNIIRAIKSRRISWRACSTNGRLDKRIQNITRETWREEITLEI